MQATENPALFDILPKGTGIDVLFLGRIDDLEVLAHLKSLR
jgi:hypothetical protein